MTVTFDKAESLRIDLYNKIKFWLNRDPGNISVSVSCFLSTIVKNGLIAERYYKFSVNYIEIENGNLNNSSLKYTFKKGLCLPNKNKEISILRDTVITIMYHNKTEAELKMLTPIRNHRLLKMKIYDTEQGDILKTNMVFTKENIESMRPFFMGNKIRKKTVVQNLLRLMPEKTEQNNKQQKI